MALFDANRLTSPISTDAPAGPDLVWEDIEQLERLATPVPPSYDGTQMIPGKDPDWNAVSRKALETSAKTRDLRVAVYLTSALLRTEAWQGLAEGLQLIDLLVRQLWDHVHPQLDPSDNYDTTLRESQLGRLSNAAVLRLVRVLPLARSRQFGNPRYRDVMIARGEQRPEAGEDVFDEKRLEAAFSNADLAQLASTRDQISTALESAVAIGETLSARNARNTLGGLTELLKGVLRVLDDRIQNRQIEAPAVANELEVGPDIQVARSSAATRAGAPAQISSHADVTTTLDRLIAWYQKSEPASPVPILLTRARRLVGKDFAAIVGDLLPGGVSDLDHFRGRDESEETE